jgi:hypothetical protein
VQPAAVRAAPALEAADVAVGEAAEVTERLRGDEPNHHLAAERGERRDHVAPVVPQRRGPDDARARRAKHALELLAALERLGGPQRRELPRVHGVEAALVDAVGEDAGELDVRRRDPEPLEEQPPSRDHVVAAGDHAVLHLEVGADVQLQHDRPAGPGAALAALQDDEVRALFEPLDDPPADELLVLLEQLAEAAREHLARDEAVDVVLDVLREVRVRVRDAVREPVAVEHLEHAREHLAGRLERRRHLCRRGRFDDGVVDGSRGGRRLRDGGIDRGHAPSFADTA